MRWLISFEFFGTQHFFVICWVVYSEMIFKVACCKYQKNLVCTKTKLVPADTNTTDCNAMSSIKWYMVGKWLRSILFTEFYWLLWYCNDFEYVSKCCQFRFVLTASSCSIVFFIFANPIDEKSRQNTIGCKTLMGNYYNSISKIATHEYILQVAKK